MKMFKRFTRNRIKKEHRPLNKKKLWLIIGGVILIIAASAITLFVLFTHKTKSTPAKHTVAKAVQKTVAVKYYSPLTGLEVANESAETAPVTGVMIENSPNARPQSGLKNSGVVFEAIAEGGITRFLVLYQQEKPQLVGPVRSLRPYDIDWAAAFDASIAHVGGSQEALTEVRNGNYRDIDEFLHGSYYWRSSDRYAPHNMYTSFDNLDKLNASLGYTSSKFTGFTRVDEKASKSPNATQINVTISSATYNSSYNYNSSTNSYDRSQGGAAHLDREDGQISPKVVIVMYVDEVTLYQDGNRQKITTIGSGRAVIFQNGTATEVTWSKTSQTNQITFTNSDGKDVPLVRGQTWITAVPNDGGGVTWQ